MTRPHRRDVLRLAGALVPAPALVRADPVTVTDMLGRRVTLARAPRRIVLLEAVDILTMATLHPSPSELVVGWAAIDRIDSDVVRAGYDTSAVRPITVVGAQTAETVSLEGLLSLQPDLVVATPFMQPGGGAAETVQRLESLGVPVLFSSSASNGAEGGERAPETPVDAFRRLMRMWGTLLGRKDKAEELIGLHETRYARITQRLVGRPAPKTYLEVMSLYDQCCFAAGSRVWGELLTAAGGRPLDGLVAPWTAQLSLEGLIAQQPAVYIATGGGYASTMRPAIGPGLDAAGARENLRRLTRRVGFELLPAVQDNQVHGIWTGLITIPPLNVVFVEVAAAWLHPTACADVDPHGTLDEINHRFLATPIAGPLWATLSETGGRGRR